MRGRIKHSSAGQGGDDKSMTKSGLMDRRTEMLKYVTLEQRGIEIAPWFSPLVPKREGYNTLVLDVFDAARLRRNAESDHDLPKEIISSIEEVDLVGSATTIAELVEQRDRLESFDYVISSHNFEHLPDPIRFIRGCEQVLKLGGTLSMALPDRRACFDYFRPHSTTADFLESFFRGCERPSGAQVFRQNSLHSRLRRDGREHLIFSITDNPSCITPLETLEGAYQEWEAIEQNRDNTYRDVHCWVFTPASLEIILTDLRFLGFICFEISEITQPNGHEFYVHLHNVARTPIARCRTVFYRKRASILHRINNEATENSMAFRKLQENYASQLDRVAELALAVESANKKNETLRAECAKLESIVAQTNSARGLLAAASRRWFDTLIAATTDHNLLAGAPRKRYMWWRNLARYLKWRVE
jgi:SAM-dependent methyltransferase